MNGSNSIVISKKIYSNASAQRKSLFVSFFIHASLFSSVIYFMTSHPILLEKPQERVVISLNAFTNTVGDIHKMEEALSTTPIIPKAHALPQSLSKPTPAPMPPIKKTSQEIQPLTAAVSPEASAPLAHISTSASTSPSSNVQNDSPHLTTSLPMNELPKSSDKQIGGAALGHIRAMIENAITYPSIARKLRLEGVVLVTFVLKPDGTVDTANIKSSSGSSVLDTKAIQTILSLSGDYPSLGKTFELSIPIAFNLHKS